MLSSFPNQAMEQSAPQQPLPCPRCSSSNTKFCYYNNYSLVQPRHFCKACKRYWTRGGTLRNVPFGGGSRKNKRTAVKRSSNAADPILPVKSSSIVQSSNLDLSQTWHRVSNPSVSATSLQIKFPFSTSGLIRVSHGAEFGQLGLSSRLGGSDQFPHSNHRIGFDQIQDAVISNSSSLFLSNPPPLGSPSASPSTSTMASLLASTFQQQKFLVSDLKHSQDGSDLRNFIPLQDIYQMQPGSQRITSQSNQIEEMNSSPAYWNTNNSDGEGFDPSDLGSSVPSLI